MFRVGFGQDCHPFEENKEKDLVIGGFVIESELAFTGNSDGDVTTHALCNALEQAIGGDSFSIYADEMCQGGEKNSLKYLAVAVGHIEEKGYMINNVGITIEAKMPKILPISKEIRKALAPILKLKESDIGVNASTGEGLTAFGKGEGLQAFAIVSLIKKQ